MVDPKDPAVTTTKGPAAPGTLAGGAPEPINPTTGQHGAYWVLTEEERAKGFVRPVRHSYRHVGVQPKHPTRPLTDEEEARHAGHGYVAFEAYPESESPVTGRFLTETQLSGACGAETTMANSIAETYARDPSFYGSTFCSACKAHFPVGEFQWSNSQETLGSR